MEDILQSGSLFGLLSNCEHTFCLECIKTHRQNTPSDKDRLKCPFCKVNSKYLIPSQEYIDSLEEKETLRDKHYEKLKTIMCK